MLEGPIEVEYVDKIVSATFPGVFVLARAGADVLYVGRADSNLPAKIKESAGAGKGYKYFGYEYAKTPQEAYMKECEYFHKYNPKENPSHPAAPQNSGLKCHICGKP